MLRLNVLKAFIDPVISSMTLALHVNPHNLAHLNFIVAFAGKLKNFCSLSFKKVFLLEKGMK